MESTEGEIHKKEITSTTIFSFHVQISLHILYSTLHKLTSQVFQAQKYS